MNPCGRDQWITLRLSEKKIDLTDIQSGQLETIPFLTRVAAKNNFKEWLERQIVRLPKTFIVETKNNLNRLYDSLTRLNLEVPPRNKLKDYIIYHYSQNKYVCMIISNFENSLLPIVDSKYLLKVYGYKERKRINDSLYTVNDGLFRGESNA